MLFEKHMIPDPHIKRSISRPIGLVIAITIIISILGYIDYITGEISIDLLYILCLIVVTWLTNSLIGIICIVEIIFAKTTADYFDHIKIGSHLYGWNLLNFLFIYIIVCILVGSLKKALSN
jgi:hypothetical protein